jgi:hypothetical protein
MIELNAVRAIFVSKLEQIKSILTVEVYVDAFKIITKEFPNI